MFQYNAVNPKGGFFDLDAAGKPFGNLRQIHATGRMVHCFAIGHQMGRPGADRIVDHGMQLPVEQPPRSDPWRLLLVARRRWLQGRQQAGLWPCLRAAGGLGRQDAGPSAGRPAAGRHHRGDRTPASGTTNYGAVVEEFARDWSQDQRLSRPEFQHAPDRVADGGLRGDGRRRLSRQGRAHRRPHHQPPCARRSTIAVAEHFDSQLEHRQGLQGLRHVPPCGHHARPLARMVTACACSSGCWADKKLSWLPEAAKKLFRSAVDARLGAKQGGFFYTLDFDDRPAAPPQDLVAR